LLEYGYEMRFKRKRQKIQLNLLDTQENIEWVIHLVAAGFPICQARIKYTFKIPEGDWELCARCARLEEDRIKRKLIKLSDSKFGTPNVSIE
jgi:hypothetical protein